MYTADLSQPVSPRVFQPAMQLQPMELNMHLLALAHPDPQLKKHKLKAIPLGAMLLAGGLQAWAQNSPSPEATIQEVQVVEQAEPKEIEAKTSLRAIDSTIGKGNQALRDIPQSVTVMTEMLLDDRNLDDFRDVLRTTAGVTFLAGETGEEDVRLRGFSLGQAGDIYVDGLRDAPLIERDTFNLDRVEVLKGSASMLFGKGSTGGVVNQVSKQPFLMDQSEVDLTLGTGEEVRLTGDFNIKTDDSAALRINAMAHDADNHGATIKKRGIAPTYRWGIGEKNEFSVGLYHLETQGRPLYNHPWFIVNDEIQPSLTADHYYGLSSDYLKTESTYVNLSHTHRFDRKSELKTTVRHGQYERDLWASVIRFCDGNASLTDSRGRPSDSGTAQQAACSAQGTITSIDQVNANTVLTRTPKGRVGRSQLTQIQSDFTDEFEVFGKKHNLITGVDLSLEQAKRNNSAAGDQSYGSTFTTLVGTPNDGESLPDNRDIKLNNFKTETIGLYAQNTTALSENFKLLYGLRIDSFESKYKDISGLTLKLEDTLTSYRLGAIWQPNSSESYYLSLGNSYNVSGDAYQHGINVALSPTVSQGGSTVPNPNLPLLNTAPEMSRNFEIGTKLDVLNDKFTIGAALFYSEKYNERNTDSDSAATQYLLSGKRSATGVELNLAGQISSNWDIFYNHTWIPSAQIDSSNVPAILTSGGSCSVQNPCVNNAQQQGDRPALTPKHSASLWTTYRVTSQWRVGGGLNYRDQQNPEGNRAVEAKAFTTADAMVEYAVTPATTLKLNVSNLTDELYADSLYRGFYAPGQARKVQLNLKHQF